MISICVNFEVSNVCWLLLKIFHTAFLIPPLKKKILEVFPPSWVVGMRKIPPPILFLCYSLIGIPVFW